MPVALITGASSGIGEQFAKLLSSKGYDIILVGRNEERLNKVKKTLSTKSKVIAADLSERKAVFDLIESVKDLSVDLLINNAGFGSFGEFTETELKNELEMISLNIEALHILTKHFVTEMAEKNKGAVLNVCSTAGFTSGPLMATYYATKNYVRAFTLALRRELKEKGSVVRVCLLCPGPVDTAFNERANVTFSVPAMKPETVAKEGIDGIFTDKAIIVPGLSNKICVFFERHLPEKLVSMVCYRIQKRKRDRI